MRQISSNFRSFLENVELRSTAYAVGLAAAAVTLAAALVVGGSGFGEPITVLALAAVAAIAERGSVRLSSTTEQSISLLPTLFTAVLFGPLPAMIVGAASMLGDVRRPYLRVAAYGGSRALTAAVTAAVAAAAASVASGRVAEIAFATVAGAFVAESLDVAFVAVALRVRGKDNWRSVVRTHAPILALSAALYGPVVGLLAFVYAEVSPWSLPLFAVPALAAQRLFALYQDQRRLAEDLGSVNKRLERANLSFASALVATLDARDRYTAGHSAAVAIYSRDIAARMGLSDAEQSLAHVAGLVHDIGKVGLPPGLLEKPGPLTLEERRQMERHAEIGETILAKVDDYAEIAAIVRHHHERVDGHGYPDGVHGDEIPLISRIISVADAYDAMTSHRPYRDAMPTRVARLRLAQAVESQFDTSVVAAFEAILAGASESYKTGHRDDFSLVRQDAEAAHRRATASA